MVYKVYFKGSNEVEFNDLKLTFKELISNEPIILPIEVIDQLRTLSLNNKNIINIQNIDSVQKFGSDPPIKNLSNFVVLLMTLEDQRKGFLIGYNKKVGNVLVGIWPFINDQKEILINSLIEKYKNLVNRYQKYSKICIIN